MKFKRAGHICILCWKCISFDFLLSGVSLELPGLIRESTESQRLRYNPYFSYFSSSTFPTLSCFLYTHPFHSYYHYQHLRPPYQHWDPSPFFISTRICLWYNSIYEMFWLNCHSSQKRSMCPTMQWQVPGAIFSTFKEPLFQTKQAKVLPSCRFICLKLGTWVTVHK